MKGMAEITKLLNECPPQRQPTLVLTLMVEAAVFGRTDISASMDQIVLETITRVERGCKAVPSTIPD